MVLSRGSSIQYCHGYHYSESGYHQVAVEEMSHGSGEFLIHGQVLGQGHQELGGEG